jgi:hypothetical protein
VKGDGSRIYFGKKGRYIQIGPGKVSDNWGPVQWTIYTIVLILAFAWFIIGIVHL